MRHRRLARAAVAALVVAAAGGLGGSCGAASEAAKGDFRPRDEGTLVVATDLPAPGFWDGTSPTDLDGGFEYGLAQALANRFDLALEVRDVDFADIVGGRLGDADLALAQVSITDDRAEGVTFSVPYFESAPAALGRRGDELRDLATAKDRRWAVRAGTTEEAYLDEVVRPSEAPLVVGDEAAAATAVLDGRADVALLDLPVALVLAEDVPGLAALARFDHPDHYGAVLPEGSANLDSLDTAIRALIADGTVADLAARWLEPRFAADPGDLPVIASRS